MTSNSYLIDSQVLVWLSQDTSFLGKQTKRILDRRSVYFSTVSLAELRFKASLGRLKLAPNTVQSWLDIGFQALPFSLDAAEVFSSFSAHQIPDAFDRQILATARANGMSLITSDRKILAQEFDWVLDATT